MLVIKRKKQTPENAKKQRFGLFKWLLSSRFYKWITRILFVLICLPFLLTLLYKIESVRPVSTLMLGHYISGQDIKRKWVPLEEISPRLIHSIIMSEDGKFCSHNGVDWDALNKVIDDALEGEKTRGASTLTMQTVKNLFLWNSRSYIRKGLEVPLALYLDAVLSKRRILEIYLNIAEWSGHKNGGVFGIEAGAQHYFGMSAKKLGPKRASLMAVTLPNPKLRNPANPSKSLSRVARIVQKRAQQAGAYVKCLKEPK